MYLPVLARAGEVLSLTQRKYPKKTCPARAYFLIFSQHVEHPSRHAIPCVGRAKIGIPADFDADVAQKLGARKRRFPSIGFPRHPRESGDPAKTI
jgi:hypothetical protein